MNSLLQNTASLIRRGIELNSDIYQQKSDRVLVSGYCPRHQDEVANQLVLVHSGLLAIGRRVSAGASGLAKAVPVRGAP